MHQALYQYIIKGSPCLGKLTVSLYCSPRRERMLMEHWIAFLWYLETFFCFMNYKTQHPQRAKKWKTRKEGTIWTWKVCVPLVPLTMVVKSLWMWRCRARRHLCQAGLGDPPAGPGARTGSAGSFPHRFPSLLSGAGNLHSSSRSCRPGPGGAASRALERGERCGAGGAPGCSRGARGSVT